MVLCSSRCDGLYVGEPRARPARHDEVALEVIPLERLLQRGRNLLRFACEREDIGEV